MLTVLPPDPPAGAFEVTPALRSVLDHYTDPAILLSRGYRVLAANRAYLAHYGASSITEGVDQCFAVSHGYPSPCDENGETCPLKGCVETGRATRVFHVHHGPSGPEHVDVELRPLKGADGQPVAFIEIIRPLETVSAQTAGFIGRSAPFLRVVELIHRVADSQTPVLLLGESGSGKELAANAVHAASQRRRGPFVPVECSGLSEALFESQLFGHERGAFTGAHQRSLGLVEAAEGGTLFLDEIGDVPLPQQVKLLRLLESSTYRRVGGTTVQRADFRLVCATHRDLPRMVAEGLFRRDLYFRISAFPVSMPPLRVRGPEDIALLAEAFLERLDRRKRLSPEVVDCLGAYGFPGNVRELRNLIERAVLLADGAQIRVQHLPDAVVAGRTPFAPSATAPGEASPGGWPWGEAVLPMAEVERHYLRWADARFAGDRRALARALGVSERTLYRRLKAALG